MASPPLVSPPPPPFPPFPPPPPLVAPPPAAAPSAPLEGGSTSIYTRAARTSTPASLAVSQVQPHRVQPAAAISRLPPRSRPSGLLLEQHTELPPRSSKPRGEPPRGTPPRFVGRERGLACSSAPPVQGVLLRPTVESPIPRPGSGLACGTAASARPRRLYMSDSQGPRAWTWDLMSASAGGI